MILRRIAFFVALLVAVLAMQLPEFAEQYRQRLGGAIDALAAVVARFDSDSAQQGLTEAGGIDRLQANGDALVRKRAKPSPTTSSACKRCATRKRSFAAKAQSPGSARC